jgi:hypothetical protein
MREPCTNYAVRPAVSAVADDDFAEMGAALEVAVCGRRLFKREYPVNDGRNRCNAIALFIASKSARLPTLFEPRTHTAAAQQGRVEHDIRGSCIAAVLGWSCSLSFSHGYGAASIAPGSMGIRRGGGYSQTLPGGRSSMIARSLESVSGSRLLCPAVVIK